MRRASISDDVADLCIKCGRYHPLDEKGRLICPDTARKGKTQ